MNDLADRIEDFVRRRDHVTFVELAEVEGFNVPKDSNDNFDFFYSAANIILWSGITEDGCKAIDMLIREGRVHFVPTPMLTYMIDGAALTLPIAKRPNNKRPYKEKHWLPVVLRPGPYRGKS